MEQSVNLNLCIVFLIDNDIIFIMYEYVSSSDNLVLLLTHYWTPLNVTSVKEGLKKLMGAKALSQNSSKGCCGSK